MINLLPQRQKEELLEEEHLKLVLIFGIIFLSFLFASLMILFSIKTIISGKLEAQKIILSQKEQALNISQIENLEKEIKDYNLIFSKLYSFYQNQVNLTQNLEKLSEIIPTNVYLTNLNLTPSEKYLGKISITGFCPNRDTLIEFKNNLEKEENFVNVDFPPSNWESQTNINFRVNFELKK